MTSLAVVTLSNEQSRGLDVYGQYLASVRASLPRGARHVELECPDYSHLERLRYESLSLADWVVWVDADDVVPNDAIRRCWEVARVAEEGCVFTDEEYVNWDGEHLGGNLGRTVSYRDLTTTPQAIHHLCMFRTADVDPKAWDVCRTLGCGYGIEWMVKATAALRGGAVHVPGYGYRWRQGPTMSKSEAWTKPYNRAMHLLRSYLMPLSAGRGMVRRAEGTLGL